MATCTLPELRVDIKLTWEKRSPVHRHRSQGPSRAGKFFFFFFYGLTLRLHEHSWQGWQESGWTGNYSSVSPRATPAGWLGHPNKLTLNLNETDTLMFQVLFLSGYEWNFTFIHKLATMQQQLEGKLMSCVSTQRILSYVSHCGMD